MSDEQWTARDARLPQHFWADNEILDDYARKIGIHAFAVYMALTRHANQDGVCFPSTSTIAEELGTSRQTVSKSIWILERHGLVHIEDQRLKVRSQTNHIYTLIQVEKTAVKHVDSGRQESGKSSSTAVKHVDSGRQTAVKEGTTAVKEGTTAVKHVDSHINNTHLNNTHLTIPPPLTPPAPVLRLIPGGRGGGEEEEKEIDDEGETDEGTAVLVDECELESEERRKAELVDQLVVLRLWRSSAVEAVAAGTVATNHDIVCCKRFCESSRLDNPAGSLWSNWLSSGQVPPIPQLSDTDPGVIDAARRLSADLDRQREHGGLMIDQRALDALKARQARPVLKSMPAKRTFEWGTP